MPTDAPEPTVDLTLRLATREDLPAIAELYTRVRDAAFPAMPRGLHPPHEVLAHVTGWDLATREVWFAERDGAPIGYAVLHDDWLDSLYVAPEAAGQGVGGALLDLAKQLRPGGFCLWVFESNAPARAFYEHRGLVDLERTDGTGNEERAPDIRMAWPGTEPLEFFRGLIDDVDGQLGDLLARRAALTRAVQAHKRGLGRDRDRERGIAEAMALRAPDLGSDRLSRIVDAIITESLDAAASSADVAASIDGDAAR
ncbi:MAG: putative acetyltransferase [Nocardioides sp.]|nr:putative acetyltransferase [Nocardioides sp.]